ncbi:nucleotide sugar dehydrogenase [Limimaricola pyoseonensis]|uniref:UDP-glucose 6-dehydrogenase n=1 Tax=Limimaricola pyoseonensis TaxID=521013 RepID=A0A1G7IVN0_9RHOB|nr:nucleotide sugar dehydrogenase [Limimaricola pyoseonensis]SDF16624.1 GDP-mannose 6-dehydrogenase [Limimaricola pyoseonensis]
MKVVVFGLGYVGATAVGCIARCGHEVVGIDVNRDKVATLNAGRSPILEPGLEPMIAAAVEEGRLTAQGDIGDALDRADLALVCVGTPSAADGAHNMGYIAEVSRQIAQAVARRPAGPPLAVVYRSTIRPGTTAQLIRPIFEGVLGAGAPGVDLVYNPEFLREGSAVADYFAPPKIVLGTESAAPVPAMEALNDGIDAPVFRTGFGEAEITKFVDNSWHAVKVAFANEVGRVCLSAGLSATRVHEIFVSDTKLNISACYTRPGGAFGGSCLPKDVRALQHLGADIGANLPLIDSLLRSNEAHKNALFAAATRGLAPGASLLMVGLAFKAGTDDLRESPNVDLARKLLAAGYALDIYDPAIRADMLLGANLGYAYSQLPQLERLLIPRGSAEARRYDRILLSNATAREVRLPPGAETFDCGALA